MGRRAKKAPVQTKKRVKLAKRFKCPFCANEDVVECKMDFKAGIGSLSCRLCGAAYQMPIHHLHEPIDVFSEWLDDCEAAANPNMVSGGGAAGGEEDTGTAGAGAATRFQEDDDDDDDELLNGGPALNTSNNAKAGDKSGGNGKKGAGGGGRDTYTELGLDDSDDDDDD